MLVLALHQLPWERAAHLAVVDSCEAGWDTGAEWIAAQIRCGKKPTLAAGDGNLAARIYTNHLVTRKKMKDGTWQTITRYTVSAKWTTRNGRRNPDLKYVLVDRGFLDRNPRLSSLAKRVYHLVCFEQFKYGGCALTSGEMAERLGVNDSQSENAAKRVGKVLRKLDERGELERDERGIYAPTHPVYKVERERYRPEVIRASLAGAERERIAEGEAEATRTHSEPARDSFGTGEGLTRNHTTIKNYKELEELRAAARGLSTGSDEDAPADAPQLLKSEKASLTEKLLTDPEAPTHPRGADSTLPSSFEAPTIPGTSPAPWTPGDPTKNREELLERLRAILNSTFDTYGEPGRQIDEDTLVGLRLLENRCGPLAAPQLDSIDRALRTLLADLAQLPMRERFGKYRHFLASPPDELYDDLERLRRVYDKSLPIDADIAALIDAPAAEPTPVEPSGPIDSTPTHPSLIARLRELIGAAAALAAATDAKNTGWAGGRFFPEAALSSLAAAVAAAEAEASVNVPVSVPVTVFRPQVIVSASDVDDAFSVIEALLSDEEATAVLSTIHRRAVCESGATLAQHLQAHVERALALAA
jgi:hypothetical protein